MPRNILDIFLNGYRSQYSTTHLTFSSVPSACLSVQTDTTIPAFATLLASAAAELTSYPTTGLGNSSTLLDWCTTALRHAASGLPESAKEEWTALVRLGCCLACHIPMLTTTVVFADQGDVNLSRVFVFRQVATFKASHARISTNVAAGALHSPFVITLAPNPLLTDV